jgi:predicted transcriptional regulator
MRTTIDLPDDLHRLLSAVAHDRHETLSQTTTMLLRRALTPEAGGSVRRDERTGIAVVSVGRAITAEDVRSLDDEA